MRFSDLPRFRECSRREERALNRLATGLEVAAGSTLFTQGERAREVMFVSAGRFDVWRNGRHVANATSDDVFGELALLAGPNERRFTTVEAVTDGHVFIMSRLEFLVLNRQVPQQADRVLRTGAKRALQWTDPAGHETSE